MSFNLAKCEVIRFSRKRRPAPQQTYTLHNIDLPLVDSIKYPDVKLENDLCWNSHVSYITGKAYTALRFVKRILSPQSMTLRAMAYKHLLCLVLEYACCCWNPLPQTLSSKIKASQRRAARAVFSIPRTCKISTSAQILKLNWKPMRRDVTADDWVFFVQCTTVKSTYIWTNAPPSQSRTSTKRRNKQYILRGHQQELEPTII